MLMSGLDIQTAAKLGLDMTFIVFNNGRYGASYFNNIDNEPALTRIPPHDWSLVARGLGLRSFRVSAQPELEAALRVASEAAGPTLIDVACDGEARAPAPIYAATLKTRPFM
jgi:acetolactate synthase-1/2/3 large subunit